MDWESLTVRTGVAGIMGARSCRDTWSKTALVMAKNKPYAELAKRLCRSDMGQPTWICMQTQPFLRWRCGP